MIPAGLKQGETEFFKMHNNLTVMHNGSQIDFENLPTDIFQIIDASIDDAAANELDKLGITDLNLRRKKFIECNCSTYDFTADIKSGSKVLQREFVRCSIRGNCSHEGKLCQPVFLNGQKLSMSELKVTSLIRAGHYDKEICECLSISLDTLRTHKKSIQLKLGASRKTEIATKAIKFGIA